MKRIQDSDETEQTTDRKRTWVGNSCEWLKAGKQKKRISERKRKKLEKKKKKQQKKRRKRINARIDRTVSFGAITLCFVFSVLDVLERRGKLPWRKK